MLFICRFNASKVTFSHFLFERRIACSFYWKTVWTDVKFLDGSVFWNPNQISVFCTYLLLDQLAFLVIYIMSLWCCYQNVLFLCDINVRDLQCRWSKLKLLRPYVMHCCSHVSPHVAYYIMTLLYVWVLAMYSRLAQLSRSEGSVPTESLSDWFSGLRWVTMLFY